MLFRAIMFMVICYSGHRKWVQSLAPGREVQLSQMVKTEGGGKLWN